MSDGVVQWCAGSRSMWGAVHGWGWGMGMGAGVYSPGLLEI